MAVTRQDAISRAMRANAGKSNRAEDLRHYTDFFVEQVDTSELEENTNQLIYGRRGSGKTLLLNSLNHRIRRRFPESRVMSFCYTATDFRLSPDYGAVSPTVKEQTHAFFHSFITKLCDDISVLADDVFRRPGWLASLTLAGEAKAARRDAIATTVLELLEAASFGIERPDPSTRSAHREGSSSNRRTNHRGGSLQAGIGARPSVGARATLEGGRGSESQQEEQESWEYQSRYAFSPSRIRELIVKVVDLLDLEYIIIFIDEWASLAECQVEFAERLRRCLFGDHRIAVKIAADQFQGVFHNAGQGYHFKGLDVGGDIFVAVDLDKPFRDEGRNGELFTEMLYRRLRHFMPEALEHHFGEPPLLNPLHFLNTIFETPRAFEELCLGSQGLCRDFHVIFQHCAKEVGWDVTRGRIDFEGVRRAIIALTPQTYDRASRSVDANRLLFAVIAPHIRKARSRYFLLAWDRPPRLAAVVNDLLSKRIIHRAPSERVHASIRGSFDLFEIDYGVFIDLMRAAEFSTGDTIEVDYQADEMGRITDDNKETYLLDLSEVGPVLGEDGALLLCPHCNAEFSSKEKAYEVRRICPQCFMDVDPLT